MKELMNYSPTVLGKENKSIIYFDTKRIRIKKLEVPYEEIEGVGYLLVRRRHYAYFIPVANTIEVTFNFFFRDGSRPRNVRRTATGAMLFETKKQKRLKQSFAMIVDNIDKNIKKLIVENLVDRIKAGEEISFGPITVSKDLVRLKRMLRKDAELMQYGYSKLANGKLVIYGADNKLFASLDLLQKNVPFVGDILDAVFGRVG